MEQVFPVNRAVRGNFEIQDKGIGKKPAKITTEAGTLTLGDADAIWRGVGGLVVVNRREGEGKVGGRRYRGEHNCSGQLFIEARLKQSQSRKERSGSSSSSW